MIPSLWQIKQERGEKKGGAREEEKESRKKERKIPPRSFSPAIGSLASVDNWRSISWLGFAKPVSPVSLQSSTSSSIDSKGSSSNAFLPSLEILVFKNRSFPDFYYSL